MLVLDSLILTCLDPVLQFFKLVLVLDSLFRSSPSVIYVSVGFGFFVEFTLDEALRFIEKKTAFLTQQTDDLTKSAAQVKAHIRLVLEVMLYLVSFEKCFPSHFV